MQAVPATLASETERMPRMPCGFGPGLSSPTLCVSWLNYFRMDAVYVEYRQSWQISTESDPHHVVRHDVAWESFEVVDAVWFVDW